MKKLHEYETPESDKAARNMSGCGITVHTKYVTQDVAQSLEQKLAAAREALEWVNLNLAVPESVKIVVNETLNLIKPQ